MTRQKDDIILEAFITETTQLVEQLETIILECEGSNSYSEDVINEIFRIMHTIKGSSSMMHYENIATLAHGLEDLFSFLRDQNLHLSDWSGLSDLMLEGVDFTKVELSKVIHGEPVDGDVSGIIENVKLLLMSLEEDQSIPVSDETNHFKAVIFFAEDCELENVRAFQIVHNLNGMMNEYWHIPENIDDRSAIDVIRNQGFQLFMRTDKSYDEIHAILSQTTYLRHLEVHSVPSVEVQENVQNNITALKDSKSSSNSVQVNSIKVNVSKLDELMDLVGELVIAEAMVTQNPDLTGLQLEQFQKAARHLQKISKEIQGKVMEIRMVPLAMTFQKMHRVVRDMSKKLNKNVQLHIIGEDTEVDKNIIEHISDPIMHLVRNSIDHGLESAQERLEAGKPEMGTLTLEAQNVGGEVLIIVKEDGRGLNRAKILEKAKENQILYKPEAELSDKEVYNLIFLPGFSTKENITEFSGRGVGMDVVMQNIAALGGTVSIDSHPGQGTTVSIRIPLTLAIIDGMNLRVGDNRYILPTASIKKSLKPNVKNLITDPNGNEMIMVRGECYPILRLHERYRIPTDRVQLPDGILILVEQEGNKMGIFADELIGQQQVVVKALPSYIRMLNKVDGISGCTLLGDGDISLILDVSGLLKAN